MWTTRNTFLSLSCFFLVIAVSTAFIDFDYYYNDKNYCPGTEYIVKDVVREYVEKDRGLGVGLIRMFFHDCFFRVEVLSKLQHPNLVKLKGACAEKHALIYEYLPNGSLEDRLPCKNNTSPLSWQARVCIAFEICEALSFLHCSKIVHGDLKPSNVLLDLNNVSKLRNFGLCRQVNLTTNTSRPFHYTEFPKGTFGYIDPEYSATGTMTHQNDVYSFGIMLLQFVTCRNPWNIRQLVEKEHGKGTLKSLIDASAGPWPFKEAEKMISLGLRCSNIMRKNRPDLSTIVLKEMKSMADVVSASQSSTSWAASLFRWCFCN